MKTAKALGIEVPNSMQLLADEVIEGPCGLLHCMSPLLMWWTAPVPGDESP